MLLLLLLLSCASFLSSNAQSTSDTTGCSSGLSFSGEYASGSYNLKWFIDCDKNEFQGLVTVGGTGWVAFGLNDNLYMPDAYIIQARVNTDSSVEHRAAQNGAYSRPTLVQTDIYTNINGTKTGSQTTIGFSRPLTVAAPDHSISPTGNNLIWAYHPTSNNYDTQHASNSMGSAPINFYSGKTGGGGSTPGGKDYPLIHGSLMLLAWGFLAPAGTFVARYLKGIGHPWYIIHIAIQYTVLALTLSAFIIIENDIGHRSHFTNPHGIIGLTIVILTLIQVIMGILANAKFKPDRSKVPTFPDKLHWYLGRLVILYAISNCFVGMDQYGFTHFHDAPFISFAVWIAVVAILFIITEIKTGQIHHVQVDSSGKFEENKFSIIVYISIFVTGIILYAVTLHEMWDI